MLGSVLILFFTCSCPVFPAPLIEEIVFSPLCIFASFVKVTISAWIYLQAFSLVPLVYTSVFVPVPYCLNNCGFEVRKVGSSSSILLSQDCFGYLGSFVFPYRLWNYPSSVKNTIGSLMQIALNLLIALGSVVIFTVLILPIQEHGISLQLFVSSLISFISVL